MSGWPAPLAQRLEGRAASMVPLTAAHGPELREAASHPEIWEWLGLIHGRDRRALGRVHGPGARCFGGRHRGAVRHASRPPLARPIGSSRFLALRPEDRALEIGWTWLTPSAWRTGANVEAKLLMMGHAFETLELRPRGVQDRRQERALARCPRRHCRAEFEGIFRKHRIVPGVGQRDSAYFSVIDDEWGEVRANLEKPARSCAGGRLMPRRDDIERILVLGSGPIVIGQAAEFDYSGAQACKVLLEEGYEVILVNSNPATIMTDPEFATATYIEPLLADSVTRVIERERPDALLPTLGGGTALNLARELSEDGTLEKYGVQLIGADYDAINCAEDRLIFKDTMEKAGLRVARSVSVTSMAEGEAALREIGLPVIVRPGFTMGGEGGGSADTEEEYHQRIAEGLAASPIGQVLVEESVAGWGEFELEVMRDHNDNVVIICSIENIDPMGVHTGDSVTVAPQQTLTDRQYQLLRDQAIACIRAVGVETGGSNIQFAVNPATDEIVVIEMNPRVSRSSALASKATGFPIAKIAARLAVGYSLEEIDNDITKVTPASFEPTIDYVVVKWPRFAFEKFPDADGLLSTHMQSVGRGHGHRPHVQAGFRQGQPLARARRGDRAARGHRRSFWTAFGSPPTTATRCSSRPSAAGCPRPSFTRSPRSIPGSWRRSGRSPSATIPRRASSAPTSRSTPAPPSSPPRRPTSTRGGSAPGPDGPNHESDPGDNATVVILGIRAQPDRPGHRVRLLLRACRHDGARVRPRRGDDQLQSRDGLHRLRHLQPALLRAAHARGRSRGDPPRAARGSHRAVRRPDAAEARARPRGGRRAAARDPAGGDRPGRGPRPLRRAAR